MFWMPIYTKEQFIDMLTDDQINAFSYEGWSMIYDELECNYEGEQIDAEWIMDNYTVETYSKMEEWCQKNCSREEWEAYQGDEFALGDLIINCGRMAYRQDWSGAFGDTIYLLDR